MATRPAIKTFTGSSIDVLNAIRNTASMNYRDYIPVAHEGDDIKRIGNIIMDFPALQNEFLTALVNRIGLVLMTNKEFSNPWSMFKRGRLDYGETIEEIFVEIAEPFIYDVKASETEHFKREIPDVRSAFHVLNYRTFYKVTIQHAQLRQAFLSETGVTDLISKIIESMYTGAEYDEFHTMKYLLARNALNGKLTPVELPEVSEVSGETVGMKQVVGRIKSTSNTMEFMSDEYNVAGVRNVSKKTDQYMILNTAFDATMDVEVLATAFNMDKASFMGHRVLVDSFGKIDDERLQKLMGDLYEPLTTEEQALLDSIPGILVDKDFFMVFDNLNEFQENRNAQGLYWNYFYHVWKTFSTSPFANNAIFVYGTPTVGEVTISPTEVTARPGSKVNFDPEITVTNFAPKSLDWTVSDHGQQANGDPMVWIDGSGTLNIDKDVESATEITVTATSSFDKTKTATATVTVS